MHFDEKEPYIAIESRGLNGGRPSVIISDPRVTGGCLLPDGRIIYALAEPPPNDSQTNLWSVKVNLGTGEASSKPRRLTNWTGFSLSGLFSISENGKRLAFLKRTVQADVFVGELGEKPGQLKNPRRLTFDERNDFLSGWMPDSKAVLFSSDRNGNFDVFRQALDQSTAELVVGGPDNEMGAIVTPDRGWVLYSTTLAAYRSSDPLSAWKDPESTSLMRAPISGGPSQLLLRKRGLVDITCTHTAVKQCVLLEGDQKQLTFSALDPLRGKGRELARADYDGSSGYSWNLSPDGSQVAITRLAQSEGRIRILSLRARSERDVAVIGRTGLNSITWSTDGKGWYIGSQSGRASDFLFVDWNGHAQVLRHEGGTFDMWGVPSPDGRHLAFTEWTSANNVWMIENF